MKKHIYDLDKQRYARKGEIPLFQRFFRSSQEVHNPLIKKINTIIFKMLCKIRHIEISEKTRIGAGLYCGHAYCITINPDVVIGKNVNIHKGVTIGQENRGIRKGVPIIGDKVWIGVNATIVGKINVGNDVLIAPNSFVNRSVPDHSVVFGNPCLIKSVENATEGYINRTV